MSDAKDHAEETDHMDGLRCVIAKSAGGRCPNEVVYGATICKRHGGENQCSATAKGTRERCTRRSITGGSVCKKHGGGAPQVQNSARERLNALVDPAISGLGNSLNSKDDKTVTRTAQVILDRCGFHPSAKQDEILEGIAKGLETAVVGLMQLLRDKDPAIANRVKELIDEAREQAADGSD